MAKAKVWQPEVDLRVDWEVIETSTWGTREPDPWWSFIDAAGHGHFYAPGYPYYPTLRDITEPMVDEDGEEWQAHVRWECPHCGEVIEPATRYTHGNSAIRGAKRYYVDGEEVARDEFVRVWRIVMERKMAEDEQGL